MLKIKPLLAVSLAALLGVSCSSLQTQGFRNPSAATAVAETPMLIVAMEDRATIRDEFEARMVAELLPHRVTSYLGSVRFKPAELRGSREVLRRRLVEAKIGTMLVTRMTDRSTRREGAERLPIARGDFDWNDLNEARYQLYTSSGEIHTAIRLESKLIRVSDGTVLWIGFTDIDLGADIDPDETIRDIAHAIVKGLAADKLIP